MKSKVNVREAEATTEGRGEITSVMKHPVVRRLEDAVPCQLFEALSPCERQRFKQVVRSLAIPISMIYSSRKDPRGRGQVLQSFVNSVERLATRDLENDKAFEAIKFDSARLFQIAVGDVDSETGHVELPAPDGGEASNFRVFHGFLGLLIKRWLARARSGELKARRFFASYLLSKGGWPVLGPKKRFDTVKDHQSYLSRVPEAVPEMLIEEIRKTCKKVLRNTSLGGISPSLNASFASSRKQGGAMGDVQRQCSLKDMATEVESRLDGASEAGFPLSLREFNWTVYGVDKLWFDSVCARVHDEKLRKENYHCGEHIAYDSRWRVRAQVIDEAGKFRIITAGDGVHYTWLQPLQKSLLSNWKSTRYSTMSAGWEDVVAGWKIPSGWVWNSGDYKAATDQLNSNSTLAAMRAIIEIYKLEDDFDHGLVGTIVEYTKKDRTLKQKKVELRCSTRYQGKNPRIYEKMTTEVEELEAEILQLNGQLMGHPLSFPILCIINLSGLMFALNEGVRRNLINRDEKKLILSMTKINGDDILFPCPKSMCRVWEESASSLGLKLSVGKSYASEDFAMVNNVMFNMRSGVRIGYLNQKLILNHNVKKDEASISPMEIGHGFSNMFRHCPESVEFLVDCVKNRKDKSLMGFEPNFFIPCEFGGFGVDLAFCDRSPAASMDQRFVAGACAEGQLNAFLLSQGKVETRFMKKYSAILPRVRVDSSMSMTDRLSSGRTKVIFEDGEMRLENGDSDSLRSMVGTLSRLETKKEMFSHLVNMRKLRRRGKPMSSQKCFWSDPQFLFPRVMPRTEKFVGYYR